MRKSVQRLQKENLLVSKSYGLGTDYLYSLSNSQVISLLGYTPPHKEIHSLFYEHEIIRGNLFVELAKSGYLLEWEWEQKVGKFIPDVTMRLDESAIYVEVERGNQKKAKLIKKVQNYINLYRQNQELFYVLFVVSDGIEDLIKRIYEEIHTPQMYMYVTSETLLKDVLGAEIKSRTMSHTLSQLLPKEGTE